MTARKCAPGSPVLRRVLARIVVPLAFVARAALENVVLPPDGSHDSSTFHSLDVYWTAFIQCPKERGYERVTSDDLSTHLAAICLLAIRLLLVPDRIR